MKRIQPLTVKLCGALAVLFGLLLPAGSSALETPKPLPAPPYVDPHVQPPLHPTRPATVGAAGVHAATASGLQVTLSQDLLPVGETTDVTVTVTVIDPEGNYHVGAAVSAYMESDGSSSSLNTDTGTGQATFHLAPSMSGRILFSASAPSVGLDGGAVAYALTAATEGVATVSSVTASDGTPVTGPWTFDLRSDADGSTYSFTHEDSDPFPAGKVVPAGSYQVILAGTEAQPQFLARDQMTVQAGTKAGLSVRLTGVTPTLLLDGSERTGRVRIAPSDAGPFPSLLPPDQGFNLGAPVYLTAGSYRFRFETEDGNIRYLLDKVMSVAQGDTTLTFQYNQLDLGGFDLYIPVLGREAGRGAYISDTAGQLWSWADTGAQRVLLSPGDWTVQAAYTHYEPSGKSLDHQYNLRADHQSITAATGATAVQMMDGSVLDARLLDQHLDSQSSGKVWVKAVLATSGGDQLSRMWDYVAGGPDYGSVTLTDPNNATLGDYPFEGYGGWITLPTGRDPGTVYFLEGSLPGGPLQGDIPVAGQIVVGDPLFAAASPAELQPGAPTDVSVSVQQKYSCATAPCPLAGASVQLGFAGEFGTARTTGADGKVTFQLVTATGTVPILVNGKRAGSIFVHAMPSAGAGEYRALKITGPALAVANGSTSYTYGVQAIDSYGNSVPAAGWVDINAGPMAPTPGLVQLVNGMGIFTLQAPPQEYGSLVTVRAQDPDNPDRYGLMRVWAEPSRFTGLGVSPPFGYLPVNTGDERLKLQIYGVDQTGAKMASGSLTVTYVIDGPAQEATTGASSGSLPCPCILELKPIVNVEGSVTVSLTGPQNSTASVSVQTVTAVPPYRLDLQLLNLDGNPVSAHVGEQVKLAVTVKDQNGYPVPYTGGVTLSLSPGTLINPYLGGDDTDDDGLIDRLSVQFSEESRQEVPLQAVRAGPASVLATAVAGDLEFGAFEYQVTEGPAALMSIAPTAVQLGTANPVGHASVRLTDAFGNQVLAPGIPVQVTPMAGTAETNAVTVNGKTGTQVWQTGDDGTIELDYSVPPLAGQAYQLVLSRAPEGDPSLTTAEGQDRLAISVVNTLPSFLGISLRNADGNTVSTVTAGQQVRIQVTPRDANGFWVQVPAASLSLDLNHDSWQFDSLGPQDLGNGVYEYTATPTRAGKQTVFVEHRNGEARLTASAGLTVKAGAAAQAIVSEAFPDGALCIQAGSPVPVTVQLVDDSFNPVAAATEQTVNLSSSSREISFRLASDGAAVTSVTLAPGQAEARVYILALSSADGATVTLGDAATGSTWQMTLNLGACVQVRAPASTTAADWVAVPVAVTGTTGVDAYAFDVWYDQDSLTVLDVESAGYPGGLPAPYLTYAVVSPGHIRVAGRADTTGGGTMQPDDLFLTVIDFKPLKWGASTIKLGENPELWNGDGYQIPTGRHSARMAVLPWVGGQVLLEGGAALPVNVGVAGTALTSETNVGYVHQEVPGIGQWQLLYQAGGYLRAAQTVTVGDGPADAPTIMLTAGDLNGDNTVDGQDLAKAAAGWRSESLADYNASGAVDLADLFLVSRNHGSNADPEAVPPVDPVVYENGVQVADPSTVLRLEGGHAYVTMDLIDAVYGPPATWDYTSKTGQFTWGTDTYTITDGALSINGVDKGTSIAYLIIDGQGWFAIDQLAPIAHLPMHGGPVTNVWWFGN